MKNLSLTVKYFLTFYDREIQASGVKIVGVLIRGKKKQEGLVEYKICHLLSPSYKDFESGAIFGNWWIPIENFIHIKLEISEAFLKSY